MQHPLASRGSNLHGLHRVLRACAVPARARSAAAVLVGCLLALGVRATTISPTTIPNGEVGIFYMQQLTSTGLAPHDWAISGGALPPGLTLTGIGAANPGRIRGTPTTAGTYTFTVLSTDSNLPPQFGSRQYTITIHPPIQIVTTLLAAGEVSDPYSVQLARNTTEAPYTWSLASGALPSGIGLGAGGLISGTPTASGTFNFTVQLTDGVGGLDTQALSLLIYPQLTITTTALPAGEVGISYNASLAITGGSGGLNWTLFSGALPAGLSLSSGGVISGTPSSPGTANFTVRVVDSLGVADTQPLALSIQPPVTITTASVLPDGAQGFAYNQPLAATGGVGGYAWSVIAGALPGGITLSPAGLLSGTPVAAGSFTFTARVQDGLGGNASRSFWIYCTSSFAIRNTQLGTGFLQTAYSETIVAGGGVAPYGYTLVAGTLPPGLSFNGATGVVSGVPTAAGVYAGLSFQATDARPVSSGIVTLSITVLAQPDQPHWRVRGRHGGMISEIDPSPAFAADGTVFVRGREMELYRHTGAPGDFDAGGNWRWSLLPVDSAHLYNPIAEVALSPVYDRNGVGADAHTLFVAAFDNYAPRVYKSTDDGSTFSSIAGGGVAGCLTTSALAVSPNYAADGTLWLAQLCAGPYRLVIQKSTNRGVSWVQSADLQSQLGIVEPGRNKLVAADASTLYLISLNAVYRSLNGGASWTALGVSADQLVASPQFSADHTLLLLDNGTVKRSRNRGESFQTLPALQGADSLAVGARGAAAPYWLFLSITGPDSPPDIRASTDAGESTVALSGRASRAIGNPPALELSDLGGAGTPSLFTGGDYGFTLSTDGGLGWDAQDGGLVAHQFNTLCASGSYMLGLTDQGWFKSADGGATWAFGNPPRTLDYNDTLGACAISPDHGNDGAMFIGISTEGSNSSLWRSVDGGQTWTSVLTGGFIVDAMAVQPGFSLAGGSTRRTLLVGGYDGFHRSDDGGLTFSPVTLPAGCSTTGGRIRSVAFSPKYEAQIGADSTLLAGSDVAPCKSNDDGAFWFPLTLGLANAQLAFAPDYYEGNAVKRLFAVNGGGAQYSTNGGNFWSNSTGPVTQLEKLVVSPAFANDDTIFYLSTERVNGWAGLYKSSDRGATISRVAAPPDLLATRMVTGLALAPGFIAGSGSGAAVAVTRGSGLFRSTNGGAIFSPHDATGTVDRLALCAAVIPPDAVIADPDRLRPGAILAGTESEGLFRSIDGGMTFSRFSGGLPYRVAIRALHVPRDQPDAPLAALAGNGLYRFNNATNLWSKISGLTGTFTGFTEDAGFIYAARSDGSSLRSADDGLTWSTLAAGESDLVALDFNNSASFTFAGDPAGKSAAPKSTQAVTASLWAVSQSGGPRYSLDNGANWIAAPGGNDYPIPPGKTWTTVKALGLDAQTGGRVVVAGTSTGLYLSRDGGSTWRGASDAGSGLEATSKNFSTSLSAQTAAGSTDILVGANGATTGGVYLSGDGGAHWTQVNQGFDPAQLSISTLVKTACAGCPVQYYSGSYGGGMYTRTVTVANPPTIPSANYACWGSTVCACATTPGSGSIDGGQPFKICGSNFQNGLVVEFDGVAATGCTQSGGTVITCTGTPPHAAGYASVRVRNPDTRVGFLPGQYQFTGSSARVVNSLRVAKSGGAGVISWDCPPANCTPANHARMYRAQNAAFSLYLENYDGGSGGTMTGGCTPAPGANSCYRQSGVADNNQSYFWTVD